MATKELTKDESAEWDDMQDTLKNTGELSDSQIDKYNQYESRIFNHLKEKYKL